MQRDRLQKHRERIATVLAAEHEAARSCVQRGDKARALLYLRRRKYQETLLQQTDRQLETLQQLTASIEFALVEKDVLYGLRRGNDVLRQIQSEMSLEGVQKLMEDTAEGIRYQRAVSDMLAGGVLSNADEDDVEDQLDRIEREVAAGQAAPASPVVCFPLRSRVARPGLTTCRGADGCAAGTDAVRAHHCARSHRRGEGAESKGPGTRAEGRAAAGSSRGTHVGIVIYACN